VPPREVEKGERDDHPSRMTRPRIARSNARDIVPNHEQITAWASIKSDVKRGHGVIPWGLLRYARRIT
jgi:hypothetical protein